MLWQLTNSYMMMRKCWESVPENRPSFKIMYAKMSKYIENIAGYLEVEFNPLAGQTATGGAGERESPSENDGIETT